MTSAGWILEPTEVVEFIRSVESIDWPISEAGMRELFVARGHRETAEGSKVFTGGFSQPGTGQIMVLINRSEGTVIEVDLDVSTTSSEEADQLARADVFASLVKLLTAVYGKPARRTRGNRPSVQWSNPAGISIKVFSSSTYLGVEIQSRALATALKNIQENPDQ